LDDGPAERLSSKGLVETDSVSTEHGEKVMRKKLLFVVLALTLVVSVASLSAEPSGGCPGGGDWYYGYGCCTCEVGFANEVYCSCQGYSQCMLWGGQMYCIDNQQ
jgi:hypothetical protein